MTSGGSPLEGQNVEFSLDEDGTTTSVGSAVTDSGGVATLSGVSMADFNVGTFGGFVGVSYAGNASYAASSGSGTLDVTPQAVDQIALGSSANPSLAGELMTFDVLAIPLSGGPTPTGTIQFQIDGSNFGVPVSLSDGEAVSGTVTSLSVGSHTITAIYSGDGTYAGQTVTMTQTVESPSQVTGNVYTVTSLGDTGAGSGNSGDLEYAITQANANPGSVIDFSVTGTVQLTQALPDINVDTTINGPGPSLLTVEGGGPGSSFSVLQLQAGITSTISGLTITGGNARYGGGIGDNGNLTLSDCSITGNSAESNGGGIVTGGAAETVTLSDCTVSGNSAGNDGGGISGGRNLVVTDCTVSGNSSSESGGIAAENGSESSLTVYGSLVTENDCTGDGGGIGLGGDTATLTECSISGNSAHAGGGIYGGGLALTNCTFSANVAAGSRGGPRYLRRLRLERDHRLYVYRQFLQWIWGVWRSHRRGRW